MIKDLQSGLFKSIVFLLFLTACSDKESPRQEIYSIPLLVGEVTQSSAIFQTRLAEDDSLRYENIHDAVSIQNTDLKGTEGLASFEISKTPGFEMPIKTRSIKAEEGNDFIVKIKLDSLEAGTTYFYRVRYGKKEPTNYVSQIQRFSTLPSDTATVATNFVMMACYNLDGFYLGSGFGEPTNEDAVAYNKPDKYAGFPGFRTVAGMQPSFFINNGDNVYYDLPPGKEAKTQYDMRKKWHRQLGMYTMQQLFSVAPSYWMKDDHDTRYDDADTVNINAKHGEQPSFALGMHTFIEQAPVMDPLNQESKTYRTYNVGKLLQIWILEGRSFRSPNKIPDVPGKSIWGKEQKAWLEQTLLESNAAFKLIISPTPMVGPDDARKTDNHTNVNGFRHERDEFFNWLTQNKFQDKNLYVLCGDRHWQYHSIDPTGFEEFSCGSITDQNARLGRKPGDPKSTDPDGLIKQPYLQNEITGGFIKVNIKPVSNNTSAEMEIIFYEENGVEQYKVNKRALID